MGENHKIIGHLRIKYIYRDKTQTCVLFNCQFLDKRIFRAISCLKQYWNCFHSIVDFSKHQKIKWSYPNFFTFITSFTYDL